MATIEFHPSAAEEAVAARLWYAAISPSLAGSFQTEFELGLGQIADAPERWAAHVSGTRAILIRRFPYLLVFRVRGEIVEIVAVQHIRRRPGYWRQRLRGD